MKRLLVIAAIISAFFAASTMCEPACLAQTVPTKESGATSGLTNKSSQVDALLSPFNQGQTPGVAVLVVQEGQIVHHKGYGLARLDTKEPIGSETAFDLASMSKRLQESLFRCSCEKVFSSRSA